MIKRIALIAATVGLLMVIAAFVAQKRDKSDFEAARDIIVMRNIAHQVLRYTGDSTSPISPVSRLSANEFQIPFESSFSFKPDSMVSIINRVIAGNKLPPTYIVNVLERKTDRVVYGYAMSGPRQKNIVPCLGRDEPDRRYCIDIRFEENKSYQVRGLYIGGTGLMGTGLLLLVISGHKKRRHLAQPKESKPAPKEKRTIAIGRYLFFADEHLLKFNEQVIALTVKESKILGIFANAPNQIIDRKRLQKEIWEDEGVIVGRSLDMFISRIRKKLEKDPGVAIVNIHSKGYKLEICSQAV